nr:hypothetical protein [uncultured Cohaesibacter sp.]
METESKSVFGNSPPPRAEDVLFGGNSADWKLNACIEHYGEVNHAYKAGFRKAALQLTEKVCKEPVYQDYMIYPIAFLYRHHIELMLKDIFRLAVDLLEVSISGRQEKNLGRHDLAKLWSMIRPLLDPACQKAGESPLPASDLDGIDAYMRQLNEHDPNGESFRYSRSRDDTRTLGSDVVHINIRSFAFAMEKLSDYFDGLENWLAMLVDGRSEAGM